MPQGATKEAIKKLSAFVDAFEKLPKGKTQSTEAWNTFVAEYIVVEHYDDDDNHDEDDNDDDDNDDDNDDNDDNDDDEDDNDDDNDDDMIMMIMIKRIIK